ncbi:MAG: ACP S-malonyltransferase [Acidobacteriota bacterium]
MKVAVVFPGQASQYVGMGKALAEGFPVAAGVLEEADEALGEPFCRLLWEGPQEALNLTANTQPAVLAVSVAAWRVLCAAFPTLAPAYLAGHSLGEYSAHVAAGTLSFPEALRAVRLRGLFMQEAVPVGEGAMAALMGMEFSDVVRACAEAAGDGSVVPANDNAPGQVVIAGRAESVRAAVEKAKALGCRKAVPLPVSAPFHSPLMASARERLDPVLRAIPFADPAWPVVANVDLAAVRTGAEARECLLRQVDSPVRWRETMEFMRSQGIDTVVEVGPGTVLSGLAKRVDRDWRILNVEDPASLEKALAVLA